MNRIKDTFSRCNAENRKALVSYVTAGNPDPATSEKLIKAVIEAGTDILELGVPFSDPMADGPVIQKAGTIALEAGTTLPIILDMARNIRKYSDVPIVLFSYYNVLFSYGVEKLAKVCAEIGIDAWLVVDVPYEESDEVIPTLKKYDIDFIPLIAPTTPLDRAEMILKDATGFAYYITVKGVTGARAELPVELTQRLEELKKVCPVPLVAGFGISSPEMAKATAAHADGAVVGSAIVRIMEQYDNHDEAIKATAEFVAGLAEGLKL